MIFDEQSQFGEVMSQEVDRLMITEKSTINPIDARLLHAILGIANESGELVSHAKAILYYNKPMDIVNLLEEGGDLWWYFRLFIDEIARLQNMSFNKCFLKMMEMNNAKLRIRYPDGFSHDAANERDLKAERKAMEDILDAD